MSKIDLSKYGISGVTEIVHNPSYEQLFEEETKPGLQGFEKGQVTNMGAVNVMTGVYTGRSPKDKFFVKDAVTENTIWWTSDQYKNDNKPLSPGKLEGAEKDRYRRTLEQTSFRCRYLLRSQRKQSVEDPFHHGGCLAGSLREEHVHPSYRRGVGRLW